MNLVEEIVKEHTKDQKNKIVSWVGNNPHRFEELFNVIAGPDKKLSQRASWPLSYCIENNPSLIENHLSKLLQLLKQPGIHTAVKRNGTRILQFIEVPEEAEGEVMNLCFDIVESQTEDVAVKCNALTVLAGLAKKFPDIKNELLVTIEDQWDLALPAFRARAKAVMKQFSKVT